MPNDAGRTDQKLPESGSEPNFHSGPDHISQDDSSHLCGKEKIGVCAVSPEGHVVRAMPAPTISIGIPQPEDILNPKVGTPKSDVCEGDIEIGGVSASKMFSLPKSESYHEQCRVCQQQTEEPLMDLGCRCRGGLAKAHRSCIELWFCTKGSNKCEICQQEAANVPYPELQPSTNWVGRANSAYEVGQGHGRGCFSPLLVAFIILLGGLLLDVLISLSLGATALPLNVIIAVLIVLGLSIGLRLALQCCQKWRNPQRANATTNPGYHTAV